MMGNRRWVLWRLLAAVVLLSLLAIGGFAAHRLGWSRGYAAAEAVVEGGEASTPPLSPRIWRPMGFSGAGLLVTIVIGLTLIVLLGRALRVVTWCALGGPVSRACPWRGYWSFRQRWAQDREPPGYGPWDVRREHGVGAHDEQAEDEA